MTVLGERPATPDPLHDRSLMEKEMGRVREAAHRLTAAVRGSTPGVRVLPPSHPELHSGMVTATMERVSE